MNEQSKGIGKPIYERSKPPFSVSVCLTFALVKELPTGMTDTESGGFLYNKRQNINDQTPTNESDFRNNTG
jgi:hypothetical protein